MADSLRNYTRCGLSKENDILIAINGIQRRLSKVTKDMLIAGLWKDRLIQELCWMRSTDSREIFSPFATQSYRAPTWSWAGSNVEIHPGHFRHHENCTNLRHRVTVEAIESDETQSGQLKNASLQLRSKLVSATISMHESADLIFGRKFDFTCGSGDKVVGSSRNNTRLEFIVDNRDEEPYYQQDLVFLTMWECCCTRLCRGEKEAKPKRYLEALALKPTSTKKNEYQRVGILQVLESGYDYYTAHETEDKHSLVLL